MDAVSQGVRCIATHRCGLFGKTVISGAKTKQYSIVSEMSRNMNFLFIKLFIVNEYHTRHHVVVLNIYTAVIQRSGLCDIA